MRPSIPLSKDGSSPLQGPALSRRAFVELGAGGLVASWFLKSPASAMAAETAAVGTKNTAKNAILVFLPGAPSQIDTWDLKEGAWTPADFAPTSFGSGMRFPTGLMPKVGDRLGDITIVRSVLSWALVHGLAQTWTQISRNPTGALGNIAPHIGSVVALEMEARRKPTDVLPAFLSLNTTGGISGAGYLPSLYSPFAAQPSSTGLASLVHPDGSQRFALRWNDLQAVDAALRTGQPLGKDAADLAGFYTQAKTLMDSPSVNALFTWSDADYQRYGATSFGGSCLVAKQVLAGRQGSRFIQVTLGGWDHHNNIYSKQQGAQSLYNLCPQLDSGLAGLLDDLKATPGETPGKTLFDETLVLVAGEFGRTVGALNGEAGRDHFLRTSVVLFGGGIRRGQVIGSTDATGATLKESGWSESRDVRMEDLASTIYSALGIDWTTVRHDDPVGRGFEYVPYAKDGVYKPIDVAFG